MAAEVVAENLEEVIAQKRLNREFRYDMIRYEKIS